MANKLIKLLEEKKQLILKNKELLNEKLVIRSTPLIDDNYYIILTSDNPDMKFRGVYGMETGNFGNLFGLSDKPKKPWPYSFEKLKNYTKAKENYKKSLEITTNYELSIEGLNRISKFK